MAEKIEEVKKIHDLKTWRYVFQATKQGRKLFEYRKNDRDFKIGQYLNLREWNEDKEEYMGDSLLAKIRYIVYGGQFGIPDDYCIMSITTEPRQLFEPKPDESRLLSDEETLEILKIGAGPPFDAIAKAQDAKTASIKDKEFVEEKVDFGLSVHEAAWEQATFECQQREDKIFKEIEKVSQDIDEDGNPTNDPEMKVETIYYIGKGRLELLKKREVTNDTG